MKQTRVIHLSWGGVVLILGVVIYILSHKSCGQSKAIAEGEKSYSVIENALKETLKHDEKVTKENSRLEKEYSQVDSALADVIADRDMIQDALIDESDRSKKWETAYQKAKADKDTVRVVVFCDSIALANKGLRQEVQKLIQSSALTDSGRVKMIDNLNLQVSLWKDSYFKCFDAVKKTDSLLPSIRPRGVFIASVNGLVSGPVIGIGPGITYKFANDVLVSGKALFTNNGTLTLLEFGVPLNNRKRK